MNAEQFNELINRGYVGAGLAVVGFLLLLIYEKISKPSRHKKLRHK